jgi:hypothetical protein
MTSFWDAMEGHVVAGVCAYAGMALALLQIIQHLRHYSEPVFQRYIVRIIFMVPMYSICSFPSLIHPNQAIYWNTVRDWYAQCSAFLVAPRSVV